MKHLIFAAFVVALFFSCKSAQKLLEEGNYEQAVYKAADDLRKDGTNQQAHAILITAYPKAVAVYDSIIHSDNNVKRGKRTEELYTAYSKLQQLSLAAQTVNTDGALQIKDYSAELSAAAQNAAAYRYHIASEELAKGGKDNARKAYQDFQRVQQYVPGYKDVIQQMNAAYNAAITNIVIRTLDQRFGSYVLDGSFLQQNILYNLNTMGKNKLNFFYTLQDAQSQNIPPDQFMSLTFYSLYFSPAYATTYNYAVSKTIPASGDKPAEVVKATIYVTTNTVNSNATMDCLVTSASDNRIIYSNQYPASYAWQNNTARYTGDQRALSATDLTLINEKDSKPNLQTIYQQLTQQMLNSFNFNMEALYR
jgi:hypothetical protein